MPTLPWPGWVMRFAQIRRDFCRSRVGGSSLRMSLKAHRISSMNTSWKCICPLQIVYAYLASGGFAPDPTGALPVDPAGGLPTPRLLCPPYLQTLATPLLVSSGGHINAWDYTSCCHLLNVCMVDSRMVKSVLPSLRWRAWMMNSW